MKHHTHFSLKNHNTLKVDVACDDYYDIESLTDIEELCQLEEIKQGEFLLLGDGANVLFTQDYHGVVIHDSRDAITMLSETDDDVLIDVDAGVSWHRLVEYTVERGWGGIENMPLIPGTVGAAPIGNIAAYGQNFSDVCDSVHVYMLQTGVHKDMTHAECLFAYRESIFKNELKGACYITHVRMRLQKNPIVNSEYWSKKHGSVGAMLSAYGDGPYTIKHVFDAICALRRDKFPDMEVLGTAGSFFKNPVVSPDQLARIQALVPHVQYYPVETLNYIDNSSSPTKEYVKVAAGEILDSGMGYRGLWIGNVGLFEKHALVLVTNGYASGAEIDAFARKIEEDFYAYCGVKLEREVITI